MTLISAEFVQLLTTHQNRLYGYILSLVFDRSRADDLLQQTNAVLWRKAAEFETGTNFVAWAFRIAYYEVMQYRRKQQRERLVFDDELLGNLAAAAQEEDEQFLQRQTLMRQCLDHLSERHRDVCGTREIPRSAAWDSRRPPTRCSSRTSWSCGNPVPG